MSLFYTPLPNHDLLTLEGEDRTTFLQNLVSNDITRVNPSLSIYTTLLSPQGRFLFDFIVIESNGRFLLDCERSRREELIKKLTLYKLRARVSITAPESDLKSYAAWGQNIIPALSLKEEAGYTLSGEKGLVYVDPRLPALGVRVITHTEEFFQNMTLVSYEKYDQYRLRLGIPQGNEDLIPEKSFLLESNIDQLNGISWTKGCYIGQELTARTKYQGLVRKRLFPVQIEGTPPSCREQLTLDGEPAGEMRSHSGSLGLALIRLDAFEKCESEGGPLIAENGAHLKPFKPSWLLLDP